MLKRIRQSLPKGLDVRFKNVRLLRRSQSSSNKVKWIGSRAMKKVHML